jgi:hypothetical protein
MVRAWNQMAKELGAGPNRKNKYTEVNISFFKSLDFIKPLVSKEDRDTLEKKEGGRPMPSICLSFILSWWC